MTLLHGASHHQPHAPSRRRVILALVTPFVAQPSSARAQAMAGKALRIIVPFTPGGSTDILARALAPRLQAALGQAVVIENKPGAGGAIGATEAARAEPDGQTLLMGHIGTLAVNPALYPALGYDPLKSFTPVAGVARVPNVLVVNAQAPWRTLKELIDDARKRPGRLTYASGGNGSAAHITFESLKLRAGFFAVHIPYRGAAPAMGDVIAGQVDAIFTGAPVLVPHVRSGRLRTLAVSSRERLVALPDVPTVAESGYPGFEADQWYGLVAPGRVSEARVRQINAEVNAALAHPEVLRLLAAEGAVAMPGLPAALGELVRREIPRWAAVVKAAQVKPD